MAGPEQLMAAASQKTTEPAETAAGLVTAAVSVTGVPAATVFDGATDRVVVVAVPAARDAGIAPMKRMASEARSAAIDSRLGKFRLGQLHFRIRVSPSISN